jgi:hypothetical protein
MGSRMNAQNLPFEIDPDLVEAADHSFNSIDQKTDSAKDLFPVPLSTPIPTYALANFFQDYGPIHPSAPISDTEHRQVQIWRELDAKRRAGPFWTGTKDDWVRIDSLSVRNASAVVDPFEVAASRRGGGKRMFRMADLRRVKLGKFSSPLSCSGVSVLMYADRTQVLPQRTVQNHRP